MRIKQSVMVTPAISRDELYILRMQIWQLYKIRAYANAEHLTTVEGLRVRFVEEDNYRMDLVRADKVIFSFHPTTKMIDLDWVAFTEIFPKEVAQDNPIGYAISSLFDNLYQDVSGQSQYVFDTMTTPSTRRKVTDFYGLLASACKLSADMMRIGPKYKIGHRGDGYVMYDENNMMIFHVSQRRMHFGMGYVTGTDVNANVKFIIDKFRPYILDIRSGYQETPRFFGKILERHYGFAEEAIRYGANMLTQAQRFDSSRFEFNAEVVIASGSKVTYRREGITLGYVFNGQFIGEITHRKGNPMATMDACVMDRVRMNPVMLASLESDMQSALTLYREHVQCQVNFFFEMEHLKGLGLDIETAQPFLVAYKEAQSSGYRKSFAEFVKLIQQLQQGN